MKFIFGTSIMVMQIKCVFLVAAGGGLNPWVLAIGPSNSLENTDVINVRKKYKKALKTRFYPNKKNVCKRDKKTLPSFTCFWCRACWLHHWMIVIFNGAAG